MYEFNPKEKIKNAKNIVSALILGGFAIMLVTSVSEGVPFKWVFQLIGLIVLTAGVYVQTRYVSRGFAYAVEETDNGADLTVTEVQRKSRITVCRIALSSIKELRVFDASRKSEEKAFLKEIRKDGRKTFNYCVDVNPQRFIWIVADECGEAVAVRLSYDEKLCEILTPQTDIDE